MAFTADYKASLNQLSTVGCVSPQRSPSCKYEALWYHFAYVEIAYRSVRSYASSPSPFPFPIQV